jgi:hypothetical protein
MKHQFASLVLLAVIGTAFMLPTKAIKKESKRDIAFGTVIVPTNK